MPSVKLIIGDGPLAGPAMIGGSGSQNVINPIVFQSVNALYLQKMQTCHATINTLQCESPIGGVLRMKLKGRRRYSKGNYLLHTHICCSDVKGEGFCRQEVTLLSHSQRVPRTTPVSQD